MMERPDRAVAAVRPPHAENRRRVGYELTRQRDLTPIALGAAAAAVCVHIAAYMLFPSMVRWEFAKLVRPPGEVKDEIVRVVVKERPEVELAEADMPPPTDEAETEREIEYEPEEIDVIDMQVEELTMAPGETTLTAPPPVLTRADSADGAELPPSELDLSSLPVEKMSEEEMRAAEPAPINNNEVLVQSTAVDEAVKDAAEGVETDLRRQAESGNARLPGDTRSLSELMELSNPGAKAGVARLGTDVLFEFNQCKLKNSARITLLQLAALIQKNPNTNFIIEGHTDSIGGAEYNFLLSLQRAAAVREWLMSNKVPVTRVFLRACGNKRPLADVTGSREVQTVNRRVEIHMRRLSEALPSGCVPSTVAVDTSTSVALQLAAGVRAPAVGDDFLETRAQDLEQAPAEGRKSAAAPAEEASTAAIPEPVRSVGPEAHRASPGEKSAGSGRASQAADKSGGRGKKPSSSGVKKAPRSNADRGKGKKSGSVSKRIRQSARGRK